MAILFQRSRRPRRWAGVAMFAALLLAVWWTEHDVAPPADVLPLADTQADASQPATEPVLLSGLGPSFSKEPLAALPDYNAQRTGVAASSSTSNAGASPSK